MKHMHTVIEDSLQLRKQLLESALDSTEALKNAETLKSMEGDMIIFRKQLKAMVKTLRLSVTKVQQCLPEIPPEFKQQKAVQQTAVAEEPLVQQQDLFSSQRDHFDQDLESIREKIKALQR